MMTEREMRDADVPWFDTMEELAEYINSLVEREHDYGTCVYAMSMAAVAAFRYVARKEGCTGFQASCADMDVLRRTRTMKRGFRIINYEDLLYPQYRDKVECSFDGLIAEQSEELAVEAKKLLAESPNAHPDVVAHWKRLAGVSP